MSAIEKTNSVLSQIKNLLFQKIIQPHKPDVRAERGDRLPNHSSQKKSPMT